MPETDGNIGTCPVCLSLSSIKAVTNSTGQLCEERAGRFVRYCKGSNGFKSEPCYDI